MGHAFSRGTSLSSKVCNTTVSDAPHVHFLACVFLRTCYFFEFSTVSINSPIDGFKTLRSNGEGTWSAVVLPTSSADIHLLTSPFLLRCFTATGEKNSFLFFLLNFTSRTRF